jgi:hypothetical protein
MRWDAVPLFVGVDDCGVWSHVLWNHADGHQAGNKRLDARRQLAHATLGFYAVGVPSDPLAVLIRTPVRGVKRSTRQCE